jgi:hypothetical protein
MLLSITSNNVIQSSLTNPNRSIFGQEEKGFSVGYEENINYSTSLLQQ